MKEPAPWTGFGDYPAAWDKLRTLIPLLAKRRHSKDRQPNCAACQLLGVYQRMKCPQVDETNDVAAGSRE